MMTTYCIKNLKELANFLSQINKDAYVKEIAYLSGSSIGAHIRHILEFYICLIDGCAQKAINYDARKRDLKIERDLNFALEKIKWISEKLDQIQDCTPLTLKADFGTDDKHQQVINTSLNRELAYCLEHSIHHQALLKVAAMELKIGDLIQNSFGVAPSTLKYQKRLN